MTSPSSSPRNSHESFVSALTGSDSDYEVDEAGSFQSGSPRVSWQSASSYDSSKTDSDEESSLGGGQQEPSGRTRGLFARCLPKLALLKEYYSKAAGQNQHLRDERDEQNRWNLCIDEAIAMVDAGKNQISTSRVKVSLLAEASSSEEEPTNPIRETIKTKFNGESFPNNEERRLQVLNLLEQNVDDKTLIEQLAILKHAKGLSHSMLNLAQAMKETARAPIGYEFPNRTDEVNEKIAIDRQALANAYLKVERCKLSFDEANGLLNELLNFNVLDEKVLNDLYQRYMKLSQDRAEDTSYEYFKTELYSQDSVYLHELNRLVSSLRDELLQASKEYDHLKSDQRDHEFEEKFFATTIEEKFNRFLPKWGNIVSNTMESIELKLIDKTLNSFGKMLQTAKLISLVAFYVISNVGSLILFGSLATLWHVLTIAVFCIYRAQKEATSKITNCRDYFKRFKINPKDEFKANEEKINSDSRKLEITRVFLQTQNVVADARLNRQAISASDLNQASFSQVLESIPACSAERSNSSLNPDMSTLAPLANVPQTPANLSEIGSQRISHRVPQNAATCRSEIIPIQQESFAKSAQQLVVDSQGDTGEDSVSALCWKDNTAIAFREVETLAARPRRNRNQSNSLETGSAKISHRIPQNATTGSSVSIAKT
ncbi:MAG: hypothetical protein EB053_03065 [Chlamydiae bacterium]|nr:hypothetical protein [Chlamydiota bacterium]